MKKYWVPGTILLALVLDQVLKFWVKTNMYLTEEFNVVGDKFRFHFIENEGMAFGLNYGGETGKIILTVFRILAVIFIGYYLFRLHKKQSPIGLRMAMALIFAGALGNIIDSVFYGVLFEESDWRTANIAQFLPEDGGYAPLLQGRVVDMFYFPLFDGRFPDWLPFIGGNEFLFFRPVFNLADSYITTGVLMILVFQKRYFKKDDEKEDSEVDDLPENSSPDQDEVPEIPHKD